MRAALPCLLIACGAPPTAPGAATGDTDPGALGCAFDADDTQADATPLADTTRAVLCPAGDHDWYAAEATGELLAVTLALPDADGVPLALTYTLWDAGGPFASPAAGEVVVPGTTRTLVHRAAGPVWVQVRDAVDGAADPDHAYTLTLSSLPEPDVHEPNDAPSSPTIVGLDVVLEAALASRGDRDHYAVDVVADGLLDLRLDAALVAAQPLLVVTDPDGRVVLEVPVDGPQGAHHTLAVTPGTWQLAVHDDDDRDHDAQATYELGVRWLPDPDPFEPDDSPAQAVDLGALTCDDGWQTAATITGALARSGDVDWSRLDLSGCGRGIVEAQLTWDAGPTASLDTSLRLVRSEPGSTCAIDTDCLALAVPCDGGSDCELLGSTCLPSGQCAGAGLCLPDRTCAATMLQEVAPAGAASATLSAPLDGVTTAWLAVSDHRGDALDLDTAYRLDVSVRTDPDPHEPNDVHPGGPPVSADPGAHAARAVEIPVHDCAGGDCCDDGTWVTGVLATAYDQDWFRYRHPCPGADCMVRIHWRHDAGPVDPFLQVFRGTRLWFDQLTGVSDAAWQDARQGTFGGLDPSDQCFYAYDGHTGSPYWYHLAVRDTVWVSSGQRTAGTWDWSATQTYGVCVETLAAGCQSPCQVLPGGCNP